MPTPRSSGSPTISDVARVVGVSRSTVSRAFSRPDVLREDTVAAVHRAATKLGYRPNQVARALSTGRHGNIAIVLPDIANPFFPPLLRAAQVAADSGGFSLFLADSDEDAAREWILVQKMSNQTDGFILASSRLRDAKIKELAARHPVVLINRDTPGIPRVLIDTMSGTDEAVTHLVQLGHKRLVYVGGPTASWSDQQRRLAVQAACRREQITLELLTTPRPTFDAGIAICSAVLKARATAALAFDDFVASGLLAGLAQRGIDVPTDFSVIGCDDVLGAFTHPALTSISARCSEAGRIATGMLLDVLNTAEKTDLRCILDTTLIVRNSTGPSPSAASRSRLSAP